MEKDIDEILQIYDRFLDIVNHLSLDAEEQIRSLKGTAIADEIASDFCEIGIVYAKQLLEYGWITNEQFELAMSINSKFENMSKQKELWNEEAVLKSEEWEVCRDKGKNLLFTLE